MAVVFTKFQPTTLPADALVLVAFVVAADTICLIVAPPVALALYCIPTSPIAFVPAASAPDRTAVELLQLPARAMRENLTGHMKQYEPCFVLGLLPE